MARLPAELVDAGGKAGKLRAHVVIAAAAFGHLADAADFRTQRLHLAVQPVGDVLLQVLAQRDQRLGDILDRAFRAGGRDAIGGVRLLGGGVVIGGRGRAFATRSEAVPAAFDGALALHDLGDGIFAQRDAALLRLVAGLFAARGRALLAASACLAAVRHQALDARFQPLDGAVQRVERRPFALTLRVSRSVHLRLALAAVRPAGRYP